jgi:hypothetical protein
METNLDQVAKEIYGKIQTRFPGIKIADEKAEVLSKKEDIPKARFFEFEYKENGEALGTISINLDQEEGIVIQVSGDLTDDDEETTHHGAFKFIRSFRKFARQHLLSYEVDRMGKSSLDKRDYEFHAKSGEEPMTESKMWGTPRVSYQDLGETRLVVKHSKPVNYDLAAGRTMHIDSIYIENKQGERFRYPVRHLNGARAMAQHIGHGGNPYDEIGQHVVSLSEELSKLRMFKGYVSRTPVVSESMSAVNDKVVERIEQVKKQIHQLQQSKHYEEFAESFAPSKSKDIPEEIMLDWVDRLTVRSFKEELKDVFPYIYKLVDESEIPIKELNPDDLLDEERTEVKDKDGKVISWKDEGEWKKSTGHKDGRGKVTNLSDKARRETEKLSKKEKEISEGSPDAAQKDLGNGFTLTTTNYDGQNYPAVLDTQSKTYWLERTDNIHTVGLGSHIVIKNGEATSGIPGNQTLAAMKAAGWVVRDPKPEKPQSAVPATPRVPVDYQTKEPLTKAQDGKWYNKAGEERDSLHGGPVMAGGTAQFRSLKETPEDKFERFLNSIINEDEADALDGNPESIQALKTLISQGELVGDPNRVDGLTANGLDVNRYPELQQLFDLTSPDDDSWPSVKAWMDKENPELSKEIFAGSEYSKEEGDAEEAPAGEAPAGEAPAGEAPAGEGDALAAPAAGEAPPEMPGTAPAMEGKERAKTSVLNAIRKGAKPDTKVGSKTLHDIMMELGMDPHDPAAKEIAPPVKPRGKSYADMKAFADGWWNKDERNFTIGGRGVKTKIEKQFQGADQKDLERIFANIDRADPPSKVSNQEHESINESLSRIRKLSGLK